jgi:hypothetical protein
MPEPCIIPIIHGGADKLAGRTAEGLANMSYMIETAPAKLQRLVTIKNAFMNNFINPEALARKYPETFGAAYTKISNAFAAYKRDQQRLSHSLLEELQLMGVTPGTQTSGFMHMTQRLIRKDVIRLGPKELRAAMEDFAAGKRTATSTILAQKIDIMSPSDLAAYQEHVGLWASKLEDRHLSMVRKLLDAEDEARGMHKAAFREMSRAEGMAENDIESALLNKFGNDHEAYAPTMRMMLHEAIKVRAYKGKDLANKGMYADDSVAWDAIYGNDQFFQEAYAVGLKDLSSFIGNPTNKRDTAGFRFTDSSSLGLVDKTYTRADEAIADLFGLEGFGMRGLNVKDDHILDTLVGTFKNLGTTKVGTAYGYVEAIPESVAIRFYQRRTLSNLPMRADIVTSHATYMNAVLKGVHMDSALAKINPMLNKFSQGARRDEYDLVTSWIDDQIGNPTRANAVSMSSMGRIMGALYKGTLTGNLAATTANYLGQTGFILAEHGIRPTITAIKILAQGRRVGEAQYHPVLQFMDAMRIGVEAIPRGEAGVVEHGLFTLSGLHERLAQLSQSKSIGEAMRRIAKMVITDADIFSAAEGRLHKTAYLSAILKEIETSGLWREGMSPEQMHRAFVDHIGTPAGLEQIIDAGENGIARAAFLFGNVNASQFIRHLKADPSGIGQTVAMFSNYPIQGISRLFTWMNQATQIGRNNAVAKQGWTKLTRFFAYGTMVGGPFFLLPVLRGMAARGDEGPAADLKNFFVEWEKRFSVAGIIGQGIQATTGEYETIELAQKLSPMPSMTEPFGPLGTLGAGPAVQLAANIFAARPRPFEAEFGRFNKDAIAGREALMGGFFEDILSGMGNTTKPLPPGGFSTILPGGVAVARVLNSILGSGVIGDGPAQQVDRYGRLLRPTSMSAEIIRQFGRPLGEVLEATEGRIADAEAETRSFTVERIKKAMLDGSVAAVGEMLAQDPTLFTTIDAKDLTRAAMSRELTPQARAMLTSEHSQMLKTFRRAAAILSQGDLSPAEEFTLKQQLAIGAMRIKKSQT